MATHLIDDTSLPAFSPFSGLPSIGLHGRPSIDDAKSTSDLGGSSEKEEYLEKEGKGVESSENVYYDEDTLLVNGEPVIRTGLDVSRYQVDLRDDHDSSITFRSFFLGTVFAGLGSALGQIYQFKPVQVSVSSVFLLLLIYSIGLAWSKVLPRRSWVDKYPRLRFLGPYIEFVNPGEFRIKEHVVATLIASTAAGGSTAVQNFAVQRLYYNTNVDTVTAVLATFSTACFGYGLVGLLRPLTVYPSEMVYWTNLPTVTIFQALHFDTAANYKRVRLFWAAFTGMFCYEIIPSYIFPLLNGVNIFCLASQKAPINVQNVFTNVFGGADGNEGLGLFSLSFDWQYITSTYMSLPIIQQANSWIGYVLCYAIILAIYYSNAWNSLAFPMISTSIFSQNGSIYDQQAVFGSTFSLNQTALDEIGLPALTGSNAWANLTANLAIGGLITHCIFFWGPSVMASFRQAKTKTQPDPHWQAMQSYKEVPWYWYFALLILAFLAGLIVVLKGDTTLPWWSYIIALILGAFVTPFSTILFARLGNGVETVQLMKMVAGVINPGKPVANLYFSMWSHDCIATSVNLASDLKVGQYLKIPPRTMFLTQVWGTLLGAFVNYAVMISIVDAQREILLSPIGTNVWSGQVPQSLNSAAVTWALAKDLYGRSGPYIWVPLALLFGMVPTFFQWLIYKRWPKIGPVSVDTVMLPLIYQYSAFLSAGVNSPLTSLVITGIVSQVWLRRYHPGWYRKYNYILGGALDGGAQVMIFILSFAVFGASGNARPFPVWAGNPAQGNVDYCNGNGALD